MILRYDYKDWWTIYGRALSQSHPHSSGPLKPLSTYFLYTGNTTYGIQNLEYDAFSGNYFAAVYAGKKSTFPNYDLFVLNGHKKPHRQSFKVDGHSVNGNFLSSVNQGGISRSRSVSGWHFKWGATGIFPLGEGYFYISHNGLDANGQEQTTLYKYKWTGSQQLPFQRVQ